MRDCPTKSIPSGPLGIVGTGSGSPISTSAGNASYYDIARLIDADTRRGFTG